MWRTIAVAVLASASLPLMAQVNGVPPSVTSIGPNGRSTAPPPSVTSMGPFGWQVPRGTTFPNRVFPPHPGFHPGPQHRRSGAVIIPWYTPYPVYVYPDNAYTDATGPEPSGAAESPAPPNAPEPATSYAPPVTPAPMTAPVPPTTAAAVEPPAPPLLQENTVLIFRDGHRLEVTGYAIAGQDVLNLSGNGPRRIALADLDLPATIRENDDRGIDFRIPGR